MRRLYKTKAHIRSHLQECRLVWIPPTLFILIICRDIHSYRQIGRQSMCSIRSIIRWLNRWFSGKVNPSLHGLPLVLHLIWPIRQSLLEAMCILALWICTCHQQFDQYDGMNGADY
jgi:hypothetical protein